MFTLTGMLRCFCFIAVGVGASFTLQAQDVTNFTQFFVNPYIINASYAGIDGKPSVALGYRKQWADIEGGPTIMNFSFHTPLTKSLSFGLSATQDTRGLLSTSGALLTVGYSLKVADESFFRFGISGGAASNKVDIAKLTQDGFTDNALANLLDNNMFLMGNAGLSFHHRSFHGGISMPVLFEPAYVSQDAFSITEVKPFQSLIIHASNRIYLANEKHVFEPYLVYRINSGLPSQFEVAGVMHLNHLIYFGGSYKQDFGISGLGGIKLNNALVIGGSYSLKNTGINQLNSPSYEVHLAMVFGKHKKEAPVYSFVDTHKFKEKKPVKKSASEQIAEKHAAEELARKKQEEEKKKQEALAQKQKQEEQRLAEQKKQEDLRKQQELAQQQQQAATLAKQQEEERKKQDAAKQQQIQSQQQQNQRIAEEQRLAAQRQQQQEALQKQQEADRLAEQQRIAQQQEAARIAEQQRIAQQQETARLAEQQRIAKQQEDAAKLAEQQRVAQQQEAARLAEQQRLAQQQQQVTQNNQQEVLGDPTTRTETVVKTHKARFSETDVSLEVLSYESSEHTPADEQERISRLTLHANNPKEEHDGSVNYPNGERHEYATRGNNSKELKAGDYVVSGVFKEEAKAKQFSDGLKKLGIKGGFGYLTEKGIWYVYVFEGNDIKKTREERDKMRKTKLLRDAWLVSVQQ